MKQANIRMGMVGGGHGAFIGAVHRFAAALDGNIDFVCGALSSTPEKSVESARQLGLPTERGYGNWQTMLEQEAQRPAQERMQFVSVVTPNNSHYAIASAALKLGFHVLCEKPVSMTEAEAKALHALAQQTQRLFCVAHTYTGYPLVKEARQRIANGELGRIRKVVVEYTQGWLTRLSSDNKQASWRGDPKQAGLGGCIGDIGTHAANMAEYVTGCKITAVNAELSSFVDGRQLDDDAIVICKMEDGVKAMIHATQIATGEENNLTLRVYGEDGSLEWHQQEPNSLILRWLSAPTQIVRAGMAGQLSELAMLNTRTPAGHPEGFLEAFANLYRAFAADIRALEAGEPSATPDYPTIEDGLRSMQFIETVLANACSHKKWQSIDDMEAQAQ